MTLWAYAPNTFSKREAANKRKKREESCVCVCGWVVARSCVWSKAHARKMAVSRGSTQDVTRHWKCNIVIIQHSKVPAAAAALSYKTLFLQNAVDGANSTPPAVFSLQSASRCLVLIPGREIGYIHSKFLAVYLDTCSLQGLKKTGSQFKRKLSFPWFYPHMCVYTFSSPFLLPPGDCFLLRWRAPFLAPRCWAPGRLRLLSPVPPAKLPHAVAPAGGRLGCGESRRWADGSGPRAWGRLPVAGSPRNPPGAVHLQLRLGRSREVAVKGDGEAVWTTATERRRNLALGKE